MQTTPYLYFKGNCLEAVTNYAETLGGSIVFMARNGDAPDPENRMPGSDDLVMHVTLQFGDSLLMASDAPDEMYSKPQGFALSVAPESLAEFERIFDALANDAESMQMPPAETFWAERFTMFVDRFGTPWMINYAGSRANG